MTVRNAVYRLGAIVGLLVVCGLALVPLETTEGTVAAAAGGSIPDVAGEPVPFGNATDVGSLGGAVLDAPVVGMAAAPTGGGYWLVAADGGVLAYGTAGFQGSAGAEHLVAPVVGMAAAPTGGGYWLVAADGGVLAYGTAGFQGSMGGQPLTNPIVAIVATPGGGGYWLLPTSPQPTLGPGDSGPAVLALQARLSSLGYWLGTENGTFGDTTEEAVYALQKAPGLTPNGIVGPATWVALNRGAVPQPISAPGYMIQVDLEDDLVMFVTNSALEYVLNTSTGGGYTFFATGISQIAQKPTGVFHIYRETDGLVVDSLGALWRPKFFDSGFAIHGDSYVPPYPVSHGCVRVSTAAIDWIWTAGLAPLGTEVWIY